MRSGARLSDHEWRRLGFDPAFVDAIHAGTDQSEAAFTENWHHDNTDHYGLSRSSRLEHQMTPALQATVSDWVFAVKHEDEQAPGFWRPRLHGDPEISVGMDKDITTPALLGNIIGLVSSKDPDAYIIRSTRVPAWIDFVRKDCSCAVRQCYNPLPSRVTNVVVAARAPWLIATPCCDACLEWLRDDQHDFFCDCCDDMPHFDA